MGAEGRHPWPGTAQEHEQGAAELLNTEMPWSHWRTVN